MDYGIGPKNNAIIWYIASGTQLGKSLRGHFPKNLPQCRRRWWRKRAPQENFFLGLKQIFQSSRGLYFLFTNFKVREALVIQPNTSGNNLSVNSCFFDFNINNFFFLIWIYHRVFLFLFIKVIQILQKKTHKGCKEIFIIMPSWKKCQMWSKPLFTGCGHLWLQLMYR